MHRETGHAESAGDLLDGPLPLVVVEPLDEHGLVRGELGLRPPSVPAADPTRSARDSISTLTSLRPGGQNPAEPYGSHGVAQLIREAGEVPRVRP